MVDLRPEEYEQGVGREVDLPRKQEGHVVEKRPRGRVCDVHQPLVRKYEEQSASGEQAHHVQQVEDLLGGPAVLGQAKLDPNQLDLRSVGTRR